MIHREINKFFKNFRVNLSKFLFSRNKSKSQLVIKENMKILFLHNFNKIGDMIVSTVFFRELKKNYPNFSIDVVCGFDNSQVLKNSKYIDNIFYYKKNLISNYLLSKKLKENNYDIVIDINEHSTFTKIMFVSNIEGRLSIGFKKQDYSMYDVSINTNFKNVHEIERYKELLKLFKIDNINSKYEVYVDDNNKFGKILKEKYKDKKIIVLNRYGANKHRTFNESVMIKLINEILKISEDIIIILIYPPSKENESLIFSKKVKNDRVICLKGIRTILDSAAILNNSQVVVSPETSIVHLSCALNTNLVAIYRNETKNKEWGPISEKATVIISNKSNDINYLDILEVVEKLKEII